LAAYDIEPTSCVGANGRAKPRSAPSTVSTRRAPAPVHPDGRPPPCPLPRGS
jgi:hypothetical protein